MFLSETSLSGLNGTDHTDRMPHRTAILYKKPRCRLQTGAMLLQASHGLYLRTARFQCTLQCVSKNGILFLSTITKSNVDRF